MINTVDDLKEYILRALGSPLVDVNVTNEQMDDRLGNAFAFFQDYYWDGSERVFWHHKVDQTDITNGYLTVPDYIWGITRVFPISDTALSSYNLFDVEYQVRSNDLYWRTSFPELSYYSQVMSNLSLMNWVLNPETEYRFNRLTSKLYIDSSQALVENNVIMAEGFAPVDPSQFPRMLNDNYLQSYAVAHVKAQWATNIKKYSNITLPGGVQLDGISMYQEAQAEIKDIEDFVMNSSPVMMPRIG